MFKSKQVVGGVVIAGFLAVVTLLGPSAGLSPFINTASAGYGGNGGGAQKVTICHDGKTIKVAKSAVAAHLNHGDTKGTCPVVPQVLGESTTAEKQKTVVLQKQLITLLQQLLALLQVKN